MNDFVKVIFCCNIARNVQNMKSVQNCTDLTFYTFHAVIHVQMSIRRLAKNALNSLVWNLYCIMLNDEKWMPTQLILWIVCLIMREMIKKHITFLFSVTEETDWSGFNLSHVIRTLYTGERQTLKFISTAMLSVGRSIDRRWRIIIWALSQENLLRTTKAQISLRIRADWSASL